MHAEREQMTQERESPTSGPESLLNPDLALPTDLTREYLIGKCEYFSSIGIWPRKDVLDPEGWLGNFLPEEVDHALYLLNAFTYFAKNMVDQIFSTSIRSIGRLMTKEQWTEFLSSAIVTLVTGEEPNVTDSGHVYVPGRQGPSVSRRKRIISPEDAFNQIQRGFNGAVVFVDDFVGSGNQFKATWCRTFRTPCESFKCACAEPLKRSFIIAQHFVPNSAWKQINRACPGVAVNPGVFIPDQLRGVSSRLNRLALPSPEHRRRVPSHSQCESRDS